MASEHLTIVNETVGMEPTDVEILKTSLPPPLLSPVMELNLREWSPMSNLLNKIPMKAQKGLSTMHLELTCIAATSGYLALGTNVGLIYWYNRKEDILERLKVENSTSPISCVKLVSSVDFMLAAGNKDGLITIFQIPKFSEEELAVNNNHFIGDRDESKKKPVQRYIVSDLHKCIVTALEWSANGMKLFSGDMNGNVVLTEMDYCIGISKSVSLLDEKKEIVQLSYGHMHLLISSTFRSIIYSLENKKSHKVGTQDRKILGNYGAILECGLWSKKHKLYAVRPGARLWMAAAIDGTVECTFTFKDVIKGPHPYVPMINPTPVKKRAQDFQFGILYHFMGKYLVTSHKDILYVVDPVGIRILGSCHELKNIISLAVQQDEIFVLESVRNVVRISSQPDEQCPTLGTSRHSDFYNGSRTIPDLMSASISDFRLPQEPFTFLSTKLKETSRALPKINSTILTTLKYVMEAEMDIQDGHVIPLHDSSIPNITFDKRASPNMAFQASISTDAISPNLYSDSRFENISKQPYEDVMISQFRPEKKKRKKKLKMDTTKKTGSNSEISDSLSVSSVYSSNSEGDSARLALGIWSPSLTRKRTSVSSHSNSNISASVSTETSESSLKMNDQDLDSIVTIKQSHLPANYDSNHFFPEVTLADIELKEEILARRLNWPELLPESAEPLGVDSNQKDENDESFFNPVNCKNQSHSSRETPDTIKDENHDSTSSVMNLFDSKESEDVIAVDLSLSLQLQNDLSLSTPRISTEGSEADLRFDSSIDIYTKYAQPEDSSTSSFSFGPPSGSSNTVFDSDSKSLLENIEQVKNEYQNDTLTSITDKLTLQDMTVDAVIGNDHWLQYKLPCSVSSLSQCDLYIVCTDSRNAVYYSQLGEMSLHWVKTDYCANQMSISPNSHTVWRLYKGTLYSLCSPSRFGPFSTDQEGEWKNVLKNVTHISVQQNLGWIIKTDGSVYITKNPGDLLSEAQLKKIHTPWSVTQISTLSNSVWALTSDGRVLVRFGITEEFPEGTEWSEKKLNLPPICALCIGPSNSAWISDVHSNLYFMSGMSERSPMGNTSTRKVSFGDYIFQPANNCSMHLSKWKAKFSESFRPRDKLSSLLNSKSTALLCGSSFSVWFTVQGSSTIYVNKTAVTGHSFETIKLDASLKPNNWTNVFAGSVYRQHGFLWLLDSKGKLCYCPPNGGKLQAIDTPCSDPLISVAPAPEALWILNTRGQIYGRCNITAMNPLGHGWDKIPLSSVDSVHFVHVSCGSDVAWACDNRGDIYMRTGSLQPPSSTDMSPAWVQVDGSPTSSQNSIFTKVYVGTNGHMVWALDNCKNIYAREAIYPELPIGTRWILVSGIEAIRLTISESAVWALSPKGEIFRRFEISKINFVGEYWRKVPGIATVLTASLCDEIWALDANGHLMKHSHEMLQFEIETSSSRHTKALDEEDQEWELVG